MHKRIHILLFFLPLLAFVLHLPSLDAGEWSDVLRKARLGEQKVEFYGLVLDQFEKPVEGAKVLFEYSAYGFPMPINRKGRTLTGADGRFEIHGGKAAILYITDIVLRGCEFSLKSNINTSFDYDRSYVKRHRPDKKNPVVFHLRRKHTEAVVLLSCESRIRINGGAGEEWLGLDLSSGDTVEPRFKGNQQYFHDLEFTWEHDEEKKEWALTIKMNGENAGVLVSDKLLYEAPADGPLWEQKPGGPRLCQFRRKRRVDSKMLQGGEEGHEGATFRPAPAVRGMGQRREDEILTQSLSHEVCEEKGRKNNRES